MGNIEKTLLKELSRFKQIGYNLDNLDEQMIGGVANLGMGSHVERLLKKARAMEMSEQEDVEGEEEIVLDPEAELEPLAGEEGEEGEEVDIEIPDEEGEEEIGIETEIPTEEEDTTELDVTDLVSKQDEVNTELTDQKDILTKNTESLDDLMTKLSELEQHLSSMDEMVNKISDLEDKIEEYRPRTPEEKIGLRKHDSGPYNKTLSDFFTDKEEVFDETGKKQYILTPDDVEDYSEDDIKKSFDAETEDE